jgi:hypothetical protein
MMGDRNAYMLAGRRACHGYDWWWHSFVGINAKSGEPQPFFIEYFVINPALGNTTVVPGQLAANKAKGVRPSYAMIKAGLWGDGRKAQIHNLYPISDFSADRSRMDVRIGTNIATESHLSGSVSLRSEVASAHPELMSDPGEMSWDLKAEKVLSYSVGYGASRLFRTIDAFQMYWHVAGMLTRYEGRIACNGAEYRVERESSCAYQDKNWGSDYTNPWVWLNCNSFSRRGTGRKLERTSLVVGGARPVVFGRALPRRLLVAFYCEGDLHEFNFSKFWTASRQRFDCPVSADTVEWNIDAWNRRTRVEIHFSCPRATMLSVNYENPSGEKRHNALWNGGYASGSVRLSRRTASGWDEVGTFDGEYGGCEYGEHEE